MISLYCTSNTCNAELLHTENKPLGEAVADVLSSWHEESGPQLYWFKDEQGNILATAFRGESEDDAIVTYCDGTSERYKCVYHLDAEGYFLRSEVTKA